MEIYSKKMLAALENQELAVAEEMFIAALAHDARADLESLGESLFQLGFLEESQELYTTLLQKNPQAAEYHIPLAEIAIENDDTDRAFEELESVPADHFSYPESLLVLADLYQVLGIPEVSEVKLKAAQAILPDEPLIQFALAELYYTMDKFSEAISLYLAILAQGTAEVGTVHLNSRIGTAYSLAGNFEAAIPYLEAYIAEIRTEDGIFQLAFTYMQIEENDKAIALFQELLEMDPQYQSVYLYLGSLLKEAGRLPEAKEAFAQGIIENPYQVELYQLASEVAYSLHQVDAAEDLLKKAIALGEDQEASILILSNLYLTEEKYTEVIEQLEPIKQTENPYVYWNLAKSYNELEEFDQARDMYVLAAKELNHEPDFMKEYGLFLREDGHLDQSRELLAHYLQHVPDDLEIIHLLEE